MPRAWPTHAEWARLDCIALTLDIQHLARCVAHALSHGELAEVARLNASIYDKAVRTQAIMRSARRVITP